MSLSRSLFLCSLSAGSLLAQTATPPHTDPTRVEQLDVVVVTAGPDARTAFDLAQGSSVLGSNELRRHAAGSLGDTLAHVPGVTSSWYGPGANRPLIRGLGGDRVRVLDTGIGALDASNVSPDHAVAIEPLFASRIEVLRGPSTLLYGSSAVGGVVNVIATTLPETPLDRTYSGALEARFGGAADERAGVAATRAGSAQTSIQVNALRRTTGDLDIPDIARIDADAPADQPHGVLPNSATETNSVSVGATQFGQAGRIGVAFTHYETRYGVPTGDEPPTTIDLRQQRVDLAADLTQPFGPFRGLKARAGLGDYRHAELSGDTTVNTRFKNKAWEGRLELPHGAATGLSGVIGAQAARSDFEAIGEEVVTPAYLSDTVAAFLVESFPVTPALRLEAGARIESARTRLGEVDPAFAATPGYSATSGAAHTHDGASGSVGGVWRLNPEWSLASSLSFTERLPTAQELYSHGPHGGTGSYEIGSPDLNNERSLGLEISLRRRSGRVTGWVSVFANRFDGFIFQEELPAGAVSEELNPEDLTPFRYVGRDALFYGAEGEVSFHFLDDRTREFHLDISADWVRAKERASGEPLPRIPAWRGGVSLVYDDARWGWDIHVQHTGRQDRIAVLETPTDAYTLVGAEVRRTFHHGRAGWTVFVRGENLFDETARPHTSFLKEFAPLAGRGVLAGARLHF